MAGFQACLDWALKFEDPTLEYDTTPDAPPGAHVIAGINSAKFPVDFEKIDALPQDERAPAVADFYQQKFWNKWFDQLQSVEAKKRVFDASINMGVGTAVRLLQEAAGCPVDGAWGPNTVAAANSAGDALVEVFKQIRSDHYREIVAKNPDDAKYLNGWLARANA